MAGVIPFEELRRSPTALLFEGGDELAASIFVTEYERGQGPDLHFHPYAEAFVVLDGTAEFTSGDEKVTVDGGHVVTVPADTVHGFKCVGDDTLRVVSVHPSARVIQTNV